MYVEVEILDSAITSLDLEKIIQLKFGALQDYYRKRLALSSECDQMQCT
jgi:hypothetical protein